MRWMVFSSMSCMSGTASLRRRGREGGGGSRGPSSAGLRPHRRELGTEAAKKVSPIPPGMAFGSCNGPRPL